MSIRAKEWVKVRERAHVGVGIKVKVMNWVSDWDRVIVMIRVWGGDVVWVGDRVRKGLG